MTSDQNNITMHLSVIGDAVLVLLPKKFGFLGEVIELQKTIEDTLAGNQGLINDVVFDFALTRELESGFPSRVERLIKVIEGVSSSIRVCYQNVGDDIEGFVSTVNFGRGGEKDPPLHLESSLLGPDALTSETRLEQGSVDDLLASLGLG